MTDHCCDLPDPERFPENNQFFCSDCGSLWTVLTETEQPTFQPQLVYGPRSGGNPPWDPPSPPPLPPPRRVKRWSFTEPSVPRAGAQLSDDGRFWWTGWWWVPVLRAVVPTPS